MRPTPGCGALHLRAYIRASMQRLHVSRARAWILYMHTRAQKRCADECACMLSKRKVRECSPAWGSLAPQRNEDTHASRNEGRNFRAPSLLIRVQTRCSRAMPPPLSHGCVFPPNNISPANALRARTELRFALFRLIGQRVRPMPYPLGHGATCNISSWAPSGRFLPRASARHKLAIARHQGALDERAARKAGSFEARAMSVKTV